MYFRIGDGPGPQTAGDRALVIALQQVLDQEAAVAGRQDGCLAPAMLSDRSHQLSGALRSQPVIWGPEASAGPFAVVLEANAPVGALEAPTVGLDADWPEQVKLPFPTGGLAIIYAICGFHEVLIYGKICTTSGTINNLSHACYVMVCQAVQTYANWPNTG